MPLGPLEAARPVEIECGEEPVRVRLGGRREHLRHVLRHLAVQLQAHAVQLDPVHRAVAVQVDGGVQPCRQRLDTQPAHQALRTRFELGHPPVHPLGPRAVEPTHAPQHILRANRDEAYCGRHVEVCAAAKLRADRPKEQLHVSDLQPCQPAANESCERDVKVLVEPVLGRLVVVGEQLSWWQALPGAGCFRVGAIVATARTWVSWVTAGS